MKHPNDRLGVDLRETDRDARLIRKLYAEGKAQYQNRSYKEAERVFMCLLELDPKNSGAWYYVGRSRYEQNDIAGAIAAFQKSVRYTNTNSNPITWLAKVYRRAGLSDLPADSFDASATDVPPDNAAANSAPPVDEATLAHAAGQAHEASGNLEHAVKYFWTAGQIGEQLGRRSYARSLQSLAEADKATASRWILRTTKLAENIEVANALEADGHFEDAASLQQALFTVTGKGEHCRATVRLLERAGKASEALRLLDVVLFQHSDKRWAYQLHFDCCMNQQRPDDALRVLTAGLQLFPNERTLLTRHARILGTLQRWEESADVWKAIFAANPDDLGWLVRAADSLRRGKNDTAAIAEYTAVLKIDPRHPAALKGIARSFRRVGDQDSAIASLQVLVDVSPDDRSAWDDFVYALARAERLPEARAALQQAARQLGDAVERSADLARIAERAMLFEEALSFLTDAISQNPEKAELQAEYGRYHSRQGLVGRALDTFRNSPALQSMASELKPELDRIQAIQELLGQPAGSSDTTIPEDAIAWIIRRRRALRSDEFVKGRVSIACTQMGSGGAERQSAVTAAGLCTTVESIRFHCFSLDRALGHDFYLPLIADHPIKRLTPANKNLEVLLKHDFNKPFADILRLLPEELAITVAAWHIEFRQERPEVVHAWQDFGSVAGALAAILAGVPRIVLATRNTRPENRYRRWKRYLAPAFQEFMKVDGILLSNNSIAGAEDYEKWLELPSGTIKVIYNGVDFSGLDLTLAEPGRPDIRERLGIPSDAFVVGGVFRLSGEKQPLLWVEAARIVASKYKHCHFVLCGGGTLRQAIDNRVAELGLGERIHVVGVQSPIAVWYEIMDLFMLSSRNEGLPNVLLEAQYLGVPVVASDVGGVKEVMVPGESGWPILDATAEKLAERIEWIIENPDWFRQAKIVARRHVQSNFGLPTMYANTLKLYGLEAKPGVRS